MVAKRADDTAKPSAAREKRCGRRPKEIAEKEDAKLSQELLEKRNHRRENNKMAAAKYRQKKLDTIRALETEVERLKRELKERDLRIKKVMELLGDFDVSTEQRRPTALDSVLTKAVDAPEIAECGNSIVGIVRGEQSSALTQQVRETDFKLGSFSPACQENTTSAEEGKERWKDRETVGTEKDPKVSTLNRNDLDRPTHIAGFQLPHGSRGSNVQEVCIAEITPLPSVISCAMDMINRTPTFNPGGAVGFMSTHNPSGSPLITPIFYVNGNLDGRTGITPIMNLNGPTGLTPVTSSCESAGLSPAARLAMIQFSPLSSTVKAL